MDLARLLEFAGNHPILVSAFLGTLALFLFLEGSRRGVRAVGPLEATRLNNHENAVFLDIREDAEFRAGHIPGAIHIPLKQLAERAGELEKFRDRPIIACCRTGNRSSAVKGILARHGIETVYNLDGGITAWQNANLPVNKG